jgi:sugar O-acyltransferase (sialic acid O-acetyltransferase NeuD family)
MSKPGIILLGAGGHAKSCIDVIEQHGDFDIIGLLGSSEQVGGQLLGYPIVGVDSELSGFRSHCDFALVTVGQIKSPKTRVKLFNLLLQNGFIPPTIISPHAYVSPHVEIGSGTMVMHGAVVNAGAKIGDNCIINSHSLIEHDTVIGEHCHISTASILNGGVRVGHETFVGSSSVIRELVTINPKSIIGMGQIIKADEVGID